MRRARSLLVVSVLCTAWWACTEGAGPTASGNAVALGIVPSFQIDPALFATDPVDRIRLTAYVVSTGAVVGSFDESVSPTADEWAITLDIDLGDAESLQVLVDAELLSQGTVVWSGRLGPLTVPTSAPALAMDVYPGPLDNQDVTLVDIFGAPPVMAASTSVTLGAEISLVPGSDATPVIYWASSDEDVATVTPLSGPSVTLTAVAPGTVDIFATAGSAYDEVTVEVLTPGSTTKAWVGGAATNPTLWSEADNWVPAGVPAATDNVSIPATANDPDVDVAVTVNSLTVESGATLDLMQGSFQVVGDLVATGLVVNGTLELTGSGSLLEGDVDALLVSANRTLSGSLDLTGSLTLAARLSNGGQLLNVDGDLSTTSTSGTLGMSTGLATVGGNASFQGGSQEGLLTGGELRVAGDFTAGGTEALSFAAAQGHTVTLNGSVGQTVDIAQPGPSGSRFGTLVVENAVGASLAGDAYAYDMTVAGVLVVGSGQTFDVGNQLTLDAGSTLNVDGTVTAADCVNNGAVILGTGTQPCGTPTTTDYTWVGGTSTAWDEPDNWSPVGVPGLGDGVLIPGAATTPVLGADTDIGSITVSGSNALNLNGFTLTVSGDVSMGASGGYTGLVHVTGPGSLLEGVVVDLQVSADRVVSGDLSVYGNMTLEGLLDTNGQTVTVLGDLTVQGAGAVLRITDANADVYVGGNALFNGGDHEGQMTDGFLTLAGNLTATDASPTSFVSSGNHWVQFSSGSGQTVSFQVTGPTAQRFGDVEIFGLLGVTFATDVYVSGALDVGGRLEVLALTETTVGGAMSLSGGSVLINEGTVTGRCIDNGGIIVGNAVAGCGAPLAVDRYWTGASSTTWDEPDNWEPVGVPQRSESVLVLYQLNRATLGRDVSLAGLTVQSSTQLDLGGFTITVAGDVTGQGYVHNGTTVVTGTGTELEGYFEQLIVEGARTTTGFLYTDLDLIVRDRLTVGPNGIQAFRDLTVETATGELVMDRGTGVVYVNGNISFDGASLDGDLTGGDLYLYGDFIVGDTNSPDAFRSTGTDVWFFGSTDQTVDFLNPGPDNGQQSFQNVQIAKSAGSLTFASDAYVTGDLAARDQQILVGDGVGVLQVNGTLGLSDVTFNGLALQLITSEPPSRHALEGVTFTNMSDAVTQLYLQLPGETGVTLQLQNPVFPLTPPANGLYLEALNTLPNGPVLTIELVNPTPAGADSYLPGQNTEIIWP